MNFRSIQIKFAVDIAQPLVEALRALAASELEGENATSRDASDLTTLVRLFESDFERAGRVTLSNSSDCESVLRACSRLRLTLRAGPLSAIPDHELESGEFQVNTDAVTEENRPVMFFLFLATIQQTLLDHRLPPAGFAPSFRQRRIFKFFSSIFHPKPTGATKSGPSFAVPLDVEPLLHAVWVINDPVNLMPYVTAVLEELVQLPTIAAERFTQEVHDQRQSKVWQGSPREADAIAASLRT